MGLEETITIPKYVYDDMVNALRQACNVWNCWDCDSSVKRYIVHTYERGKLFSKGVGDCNG